MMLEWLGYKAEATRLEKAILRVYAEGRVRTVDIGGKATTAEMTRAVVEALS
jgi:isocitrate/isopropylmalate dehydrogenase